MLNDPAFEDTHVLLTNKISDRKKVLKPRPCNSVEHTDLSSLINFRMFATASSHCVL